MIGALIGDISGSRYEWKNHKSKEFDLFDNTCRLTDDSMMSLAVAEAIMESRDEPDKLSENAVTCMQDLGRSYGNAGYGGTFIKWIWADKPKPYGSYGNGSAMRVSPCGFAASSLEEAKKLSAEVTKVSHDHPEGMKGAEAIAAAVYLARNGSTKDELRKWIEEKYYGLDFTIDGIRDTYEFDVTCQGSVPVAFEAFFESENFEDAIRIAISVGGDSDTIAAMTGAVAEAYYGVPQSIIEVVSVFLDDRQMDILKNFEKIYPSMALMPDGSRNLSVYDVLSRAGIGR